MNALSPAFALSLVLVLLSAFAFHVAFGRTWRGLTIVIVAALAGFVLGEAAARLLEHESGMLGEIHLLHGLVGTWLAMAVARLVAA